MKVILNEMISDGSVEVDEFGEISKEDQFKVIEAARGKRKGTTMLGDSVRRESLAKSSAAENSTSYKRLEARLAKTTEELQKEREANEAFKREMDAKWKALAEHVHFSYTSDDCLASPSNPY